MTNKSIGKYGEELACDFLIKNGFKILKTNFRYSKFSEIDIIAQKNKILHFVEVKTRSSIFFGTPFEAITKTKLHSIYTCAQYYLSKYQNNCKKIQIDAIGIVLSNKKDMKPEIQFIEDIPL